MPVGERLTTQIRDVIGIHYGKEAGDGINGIVPYEDSRDAPYCCGLTISNLSRIYNINVTDNVLPLGKTIPLIAFPGLKRMPALRAILQV